MTERTEPKVPPLPWAANYEDLSGIVFDAKYRRVATCRTIELFYRGGQPLQEATAAFIVRAVNHHAALYEALHALVARMDALGVAFNHCDMCGAFLGIDAIKEFEQARSILAQVEGAK